jgi:hypothetical protein
MSYQWTVVNQDPGAIQFCVLQSNFYRNCGTINGSSTLPVVIPDYIVQQFGPPTGYFVMYARVQVTTPTKPLPPNGSTITVPAYTGCNPLLTQGQGYPPLVYCESPGSIVLTGKSTPGIFINGAGAVSGESLSVGVQQFPFTICAGQGYSSCKTYPNAKVYLIGNWTVQGGQYIDNESGKVYCSCPNGNAYVIPYSDLPQPTSTTSTTSTTSITNATSTSITVPGKATVIVKNTCSEPLIARGVYNGIQYFRSGVSNVPTKESLPIGSTVEFLYGDKVVSAVIVAYDGQLITPTNCPQPSTTTTIMPPPPGNLRVAVRNPCSFPITIVDGSNPNNLILLAYPGFNGYTFIPTSVSSVKILYNYRYDLGTYPVSPNSVIEPSSCQLSTPFRTTSTTSVQPSTSQSAVTSTRYVTTTVPVTSTVSVPVTKTVIVPVTNTVPVTVTNTIPVTTTVTSTVPVTTTASTPPPSQPTKLGIFGILGLLIEGLDRLLGIRNLQPIQSQVTPNQRKPGCRSCN